MLTICIYIKLLHTCLINNIIFQGIFPWYFLICLSCLTPLLQTCWDILVLLATIYVAIIVPYNASFHEQICCHDNFMYQPSLEPHEVIDSRSTNESLQKKHSKLTIFNNNYLGNKPVSPVGSNAIKNYTKRRKKSSPFSEATTYSLHNETSKQSSYYPFNESDTDSNITVRN